MKMTKKTEDRIRSALPKFQKVLGIAKARDLNESDTVAIITDILAEVFGYDKYLEITSETAIRGTFCDLAVKLSDKIQFLIECKAIGTELKEGHLRQAVGYGSNKGVPWIILTNGADWQIYRLRFEQPISWDLVSRFDLPNVSLKDERALEELFIVTKEGVEKNARDDLYEKIQCINRFVVGSIILSEPVIAVIKREIRKIADGIKVEESEIMSLIREGVLRRDLVEGEEAMAAFAKVNLINKPVAKKAPPLNKLEAKSDALQPSISDQLLAESSEISPVGDN